MKKIVRIKKEKNIWRHIRSGRMTPEWRIELDMEGSVKYEIEITEDPGNFRTQILPKMRLSALPLFQPLLH
jgi:LEA14-like dessication related protein